MSCMCANSNMSTYFESYVTHKVFSSYPQNSASNNYSEGSESKSIKVTKLQFFAKNY